MMALFILLSIYIIVVLCLMKRHTDFLCLIDNKEAVAAKNDYQRKLKQKDFLHKDKLRLQEQTHEIFTLYEMTREITKSLNEEDAFEIFKKKLQENLAFTQCSFKPLVSSDVKDPVASKDAFVLLLKSKRRKIGHLIVEGAKLKDHEKIVILGHQFTLALRRVRLYQEIERIAITDSLTSLYTRRYVFERLKEEVDRARARKTEGAILMMDVDHFKQLNDTYGHLTGDQVLMEIGQVIRKNIREIDIAGRYGGEEFCVVLPDTDRKGALYAAERIRAAAQGARIEAFDARVTITVSVGLAIFPAQGLEAKDLVDKADFALYRAKREGRNQICCFGG